MRHPDVFVVRQIRTPLYTAGMRRLTKVHVNDQELPVMLLAQFRVLAPSASRLP